MQTYTPRMTVELVRNLAARYPGARFVIGCEDKPSLYAEGIQRALDEAIRGDILRAQEAANSGMERDLNTQFGLGKTVIYEVRTSNNNIGGGSGISKNRGESSQRMLQLAKNMIAEKLRISTNVYCHTNHDTYPYKSMTDWVLNMTLMQYKNAVMIMNNDGSYSDSGKGMGNDDIYSSLKLALYTDYMCRGANANQVASISHPKGTVLNPSFRTQQVTIRELKARAEKEGIENEK